MDTAGGLISGLTISDGLMMVAVVMGPILAVQIQKFLDDRKQGRERRLGVFRDLMSTRAAALAAQHVSALNMVGLEFNGKKYTKVVNSWTTYLDHLNSFPEDDKERQKIWSDKTTDLLSDLLYEMGQSLGFSFDKVHIRKAGYFPKAHSDHQFELNYIRRKIFDHLLADEGIPISIMDFPADPDSIQTQKDLQKKLIEYYAGDKAIKVSIVNDGQ